MKAIIALGAEYKSCYAVKSAKGLYISGEVDNLIDIKKHEQYERSLKDYMIANTITPEYVVCDMHPDSVTAHIGQGLLKEYPLSALIKVQHHYSHILSCMADNDLDEDVIGISFDGTGYGEDGKTWGGEFFVCNRAVCRRITHFCYVPQPGGDIASRQGWRMAVSYLMQAYGSDIDALEIDLLKRIKKQELTIIKQMIKKSINSPLTSSAGRLFDAISSLIGVCDASQFEAEAAIMLERTAVHGIVDFYPYRYTEEGIDFTPLIRGIVDDTARGIEAGIISAKFHNTLGELLYNTSKNISLKSGVNKVVVSGGCFQNRYLMNYISKKFAGSNMKLVKHRQYSTTDRGISVGQIIAATGRRKHITEEQYVLEYTR